MLEEWKDISGYEGVYQVSNLGRVRSIDRIVKSRWGTDKPVKGRLMKPSPQTNGYVAQPLNMNGKEARKLAHRIVAEAFLPNPAGLPQVNHKNGDKTDNRAENLEWVTGSENCRHAIGECLYIQARGERARAAKLTECDVREIRTLAAMGVWHKDIAAEFGVGRKAITKIVNRQRWKHVE